MASSEGAERQTHDTIRHFQILFLEETNKNIVVSWCHSVGAVYDRATFASEYRPNPRS